MKRFYTFFLVLLAFSGWIYVADAQDASTWMPDANLRTAVRSALDLNAGDTLTQADMEDLTSFTAKDAQISSITGLEHATELISLDLRDNAISNLNPLSGLTQLETLKLKGNDIVDITALSGLTSLTLLNLRDNDIVDITALSNLTNLERLRIDDNSITDVQPLTGLSNLEKLWISGNALTNAHLLSSLTNLTTIDITIPDPPDTTAPDVSISVPSETQTGAFNATITFTEAVSGFAETDLSLGGTATASITAWDTTDNTVFTAEITPTTSGTVTLDIAADVATDAASNGNTAATTQTVTVTPQVDTTPVAPVVAQQQVLQSDTTAPDVSISVPSGTQTGALDVTITFTEVVSGFAETDLSLGGTATASITVWNTTDNTVFTAEITPTTSGTVTLDIAADVATDAASNGNTAATQRSVTVDPALSTWMPDANLRTAVRSELELSEAYTLTQADMAELRALNLEFMQITVLTGLEHAVNLTELILYGNEISDITPLTGLTALKELTLGLNQISDITSLTNLTALKELTLELNQISDITPLTNLTALTVLKLYENKISDITPLAGLTALTELILGDNQISDITPLAGLTALTVLTFRDNQISDITPLAGLTALTVLDLRDNQISNITPLAGLTALTQLRLGINQISDITPLTNLTALTVLTLYHNQISDITPLTNLTALTVLKLYHNQISDVTPLVGLTALTTLLLSSNPIADFAPLRRLKESISGYLYTDITITLYPSWDVNEDGSVDNTDLALVTAALGQSGEDIVNPRTDINGDGVVDNDDLTLVTAHLDADNGAPSSSELLTLLDPATLEKLDPATLDAQLEILRVKSDGSLKYLWAIALLESVLAAMTPEMTQLLPNYPNPFNPETWIPYHLAKSSDVEITIYDARGTIVRQLDIGHQREGYYTNRSRAAYWDGRNDFGERVASGIYFYQLQTDNVSLLRKMLILK